MKRSDVVTFIERVLEVYRQTPQDFMTNKSVAEIILNGLENREMLPPLAYFTEPEETGPLAGVIITNSRHEWEREDLGAHKVISNEAFDALAEDLLASGVCPCGSDSYEGCSVTGCALFCYQELKDEKK